MEKHKIYFNHFGDLCAETMKGRWHVIRRPSNKLTTDGLVIPVDESFHAKKPAEFTGSMVRCRSTMRKDPFYRLFIFRSFRPLKVSGLPSSEKLMPKMLRNLGKKVKQLREGGWFAIKSCKDDVVVMASDLKPYAEGQ